MGKASLIFLVFFFSFAFVSSAHYITGFVEDAKDGEAADGHSVVLWNPSVGISDNMTDVIGPSGNSGTSGVYMIDCEMLDNSCSVGDELNVRVYDTGDLYVSNYSSVVVTVSGYSTVDNLTLNSLPEVFVNSPEDYFYHNEEEVGINCSFIDMDSNGSLSLYGNFSGSWDLIDFVDSINGSYEFFAPLSEDVFGYYCEADDGLVEVRSEERTIIGDFTPPVINSFLLNESSFCGPKMTRVGCDTTDSNGIRDVFIEIKSPLYFDNFSASNVSFSNYLLDVSVEYIGDWRFSCYSVDLAGNVVKSFYRNITSYSGYPELFMSSDNIYFSDNSPVEGSSILMSAEVLNEGCLDANNFSVSFYRNDPNDSGVLIDKIFGDVSAFSSDNFSVNYDSLIGRNEIYVVLDLEDSLEEANKDDNINNSILNVLSWQDFYGSIDAVKILSGNEELSTWENYEQVEGNVFMADSEANVNWLDLFAIGKDKYGDFSENDFLEIDEALGMTDYVDSVSHVFSSYILMNLSVQGNLVEDVPMIKSTNNSNFYTGILWDGSDSSNSEFDLMEKEDLVFVSNINKDSQGKYGVYDYEITIPAKLREYDSSDYTDVYFYYELV